MAMQPGYQLRSVREKFAAGVEEGLYTIRCCSKAGISQQTYYNWRAKYDKQLDSPSGEPDKDLAAFFRGIEKAELKLEAEKVEVARKGVSKESVSEETFDKEGNSTGRRVTTKTKETPTDAMRFLERRFPERWGQKQDVTHSGTIKVKRYEMGGANPLDAPIPKPESEHDGG
jgi:hypothetical protein